MGCLPFWNGMGAAWRVTTGEWDQRLLSKVGARSQAGPGRRGRTAWAEFDGPPR